MNSGVCENILRVYVVSESASEETRPVGEQSDNVSTLVNIGLIVTRHLFGQQESAVLVPEYSHESVHTTDGIGANSHTTAPLYRIDLPGTVFPIQGSLDILNTFHGNQESLSTDHNRHQLQKHLAELHSESQSQKSGVLLSFEMDSQCLLRPYEV